MNPNRNLLRAVARGRRGFYLLPNLLTTATLFCGFYSLLACYGGNHKGAAAAILAALVFDGLDGRMARLTNTQSEFGAQYDSLSDMVAFGVAPAMLVYLWMLHHLGRLGWAAAFVFASCTALRLARFNTHNPGKKYFVGLACPAAAALLATLVWSGSVEMLMEQGLLPIQVLPMAVAALVVAVGLLMVSHFRYYSFKEIGLAERVPFFRILLLALVFAVAAIDPPRVLFVLALGYALSGPLGRVFPRLLRRGGRRQGS